MIPRRERRILSATGTVLTSTACVIRSPSLEGRSIDAIVVGGIGMRALMMLNAGGIRVYRAAPGTIRDNIELLKSGTLAEVTPGDACGHHGGGHECGR